MKSATGGVSKLLTTTTTTTHSKAGRIFCLFAVLSASLAIGACGAGVDEESASEVRAAALEYIDALEAMTDAFEALIKDTAGAPVALSEMLSLQREVVSTGRRQVREYSDEVILGEPFLNRMDEVISEVNSSIRETGPLWDQIRRSNPGQRFSQLLDALEREERQVVAAGNSWGLIRDGLDR